jgi:hypothetical protein
MNAATCGQEMTDAEFARRIECGEIRSEDFHHREHLRVAWACLQAADSVDAACARMCAAIRTFAAKAGRPGKYHETMTIFWVRLLADVRERMTGERELDAVLPAHPFLLDKDAPLACYSRARLFSDDARLAWQSPDLAPIGSHAPATHSRGSPGDTPDRPLPRLGR